MHLVQCTIAARRRQWQCSFAASFLFLHILQLPMPERLGQHQTAHSVFRRSNAARAASVSSRTYALEGPTAHVRSISVSVQPVAVRSIENCVDARDSRRLAQAGNRRAFKSTYAHTPIMAWGAMSSRFSITVHAANTSSTVIHLEVCWPCTASMAAAILARFFSLIGIFIDRYTSVRLCCCAGGGWH